MTCNGPSYTSCVPTDPCWILGSSSGELEPNPGTQTCLDAWVQTYDKARAGEGLGALVLPSNYLSLSVPEQLFVVANLERTARGLPAMVGMTASLDANAQQAAVAEENPSDAPSVWAGGNATALSAVFAWMYDDGWGGSQQPTLNGDCTGPTAPGCWGHRDNILLVDQPDGESFDEQGVYAGAGYASSANGWTGSYTMSIIATSSSYNGISQDYYQGTAGTTQPTSCSPGPPRCPTCLRVRLPWGIPAPLRCRSSMRASLPANPAAMRRPMRLQ